MAQKILSSVEEMIGNTPLLRLGRVAEKYAPSVEILAKCDFMNPAGSAKDRVAKSILDQAEREGKITASTLLVEPTSGNTGIALSAIAAMRGYSALVVMPENMSPERIKTMRAYGADVVLTPAHLGMQGAIDYASQLKHQNPDVLILGQFENPANPLAHFETTGPEIFDAAEGNIDIFVAGIGTGGTLSGAGRYLKEKIPGLYVVGVEPAGSPVLSGGKKGAHGIQGIGAGFVPAVLDQEIYDEVLTVTDEEAYTFSREMARLEGVLVGISAGAAVCAAVKLGQMEKWQSKRIVTILPDGGSRYLSTDLFE